MIEIPNDVVTRQISDTVDTFLPNGAGTMTAIRLETALTAVAHVAYTQGKHDALMGLKTAEQLAEEFGVTARRMRTIIKTQHDRWTIGMQIGSTWVVSADEIESVRPGPVGRPGGIGLDAETAAMIATPALMAALTAQDERLAAVVTAVHVDGATLAEVAARFDISRERARQLRVHGLRRLRGIATGLE